MRRIPVIAALTVAMLPITLATTTASAATATGTLTVRTYDRAGAKIVATLRIINLTSNQSWTAKSFTAKKLPKGSYAVITNIANTRDRTDTLGARVLKVTGRTTTTIDARHGRAVRVSLDRGPGADTGQEVRAVICSERSSAGIEVGAYNAPGRLFVVPNGSKRLRFAYSGVWEGWDSLWMVAGSTAAKVPAGVNRAARLSSLASVTAWVRRGPAGGDNVRVALQERNDCHPGYGATAFNGIAPRAVKIYATGGRWALETDWSQQTADGSVLASLGQDRRDLTLAGGKAYSQTFFASVWGPNGDVPYTWGKRTHFDTSRMFTEPISNNHYEASERSLVTLFDSKGRVVKKQWRQSWGSESAALFSARTATKGWYRLQVDAKRYRPGLIGYPIDMLSPSAQAIFRFPVDPKAKPRLAGVYQPRMTPYGLDLFNRAKSGGTTEVQIRPARYRTNGDVTAGKVTVKAVTLQASWDGGKTWRSMPVRKAGGTWRATVRNPASGAVALRSRITTTKGAYAQVSVLRAYTVG